MGFDGFKRGRHQKDMTVDNQQSFVSGTCQITHAGSHLYVLFRDEMPSHDGMEGLYDGQRCHEVQSWAMPLAQRLVYESTCRTREELDGCSCPS